MLKITNVFIVGAKRRSIGTYGGKLKNFTPTELGEVAARAAVQRELKNENDRLNVNGGAIALGHPPAMFGASISTHLAYDLNFSPTDSKLVTGSDDSTARVWDFARCAEERVLRGHGADARSVDWHPTKGLVATGSRDSQQPIQFWDHKTGQCISILRCGAKYRTCRRYLSGQAGGASTIYFEGNETLPNTAHPKTMASAGSASKLHMNLLGLYFAIFASYMATVLTLFFSIRGVDARIMDGRIRDLDGRIRDLDRRLSIFHEEIVVKMTKIDTVNMRIERSINALTSKLDAFTTKNG